MPDQVPTVAAGPLRRAGGRTRILLVTESRLGKGIAGHQRMEQILLDVQDARDDVVVEVLHVPSGSPTIRQLIRGAPGLGALDLDGQQLRWHVVHSALTRRALKNHLAGHVSYDVVIIHTQSVAFGLAGWRPRDTPVVVSSDVGTRVWRSFGIWRPISVGTPLASWLVERLERRTLDAADMVLAWSVWSATTLPSTTTPVEVWHPGVERCWRVQVGSPPPDDPPLFLFVGGRFEAKGGPMFLEAVRPLIGRGAARAHIVTQDPLPAMDGIEISRLEPGSREIMDLFSRASALVLPSLGDAVPWVIAEAMSRGCPVIATPIGAVAEMVGPAGLVREIPSARILEEAMNSLVDDSLRLDDLRRRALEQAHSFDDLANGARLLDLIASLSPGAERRPGTAPAALRRWR